VYPHRIRLRGPWQCEPLGGPAPRTMTLPCRWAEGGLEGFAGTVRFVRRFGYPGRIDDFEHVWLTCAGITGRASVSLNGQLLGRPDDPSSGFEYEITPQLRERNELSIEVEAGADGGVWGEVALEVRRTAFLRDVEMKWQGGRLHVSGEVAGTAERPLELYVVVDRSTAAYGKAKAGERFTLVSEPLALASRHSIRVDLVDGATVWYTLDRMLDVARPAEECNG